MKRMFIVFLVIVMMCSVLLVGCGNKDASPAQNETVVTNDSPPSKELDTTPDTIEGQYVRNGKFYLGELYVFIFPSTSNGESRPAYEYKMRIDEVTRELEAYKIADVHNDTIAQCVSKLVELRITSPDDFFHLKNGDTVVWETTINQAKLDEFNSYIQGIEVVVEDTYTVIVEGMPE